ADGGPDLPLGRGLDDDAVGHESGGRLNSRRISSNTSSAGRPRPARMSSRPWRMPSSTRVSSASSRCRSKRTASVIASSEEVNRPLRTLAWTNRSRSLGKFVFMRSKILPISLVPEAFDQPFQLVELAAAGDQGRLAGLDDDDVVEAERGDQAAVVGDDDRVRGLVGEHVALDGVALRVLGEQAGQGSPVADVVPVVT